VAPRDGRPAAKQSRSAAQPMNIRQFNSDFLF
jgi:hypothetical protein